MYTNVTPVFLHKIGDRGGLKLSGLINMMVLIFRNPSDGISYDNC